jgi:hypothetical protein
MNFVDSILNIIININNDKIFIENILVKIAFFGYYIRQRNLFLRKPFFGLISSILNAFIAIFSKKLICHILPQECYFLIPIFFVIQTLIFIKYPDCQNDRFFAIFSTKLFCHIFPQEFYFLILIFFVIQTLIFIKYPDY